MLWIDHTPPGDLPSGNVLLRATLFPDSENEIFFYKVIQLTV